MTKKSVYSIKHLSVCLVVLLGQSLDLALAKRPLLHRVFCLYNMLNCFFVDSLMRQSYAGFPRVARARCVLDPISQHLTDVPIQPSIGLILFSLVEVAASTNQKGNIYAIKKIAQTCIYGLFTA